MKEVKGNLMRIWISLGPLVRGISRIIIFNIKPKKIPGLMTHSYNLSISISPTYKAKPILTQNNLNLTITTQSPCPKVKYVTPYCKTNQ
jgi:hypothetical protein